MKDVDWQKVEAARRRGKLGAMRPGDQELVERAMQQDPERYRQMSQRVVAEVIAEEKRRWGGDSDDP